jgi:hypothetical protein
MTLPKLPLPSTARKLKSLRPILRFDDATLRAAWSVPSVASDVAEWAGAPIGGRATTAPAPAALEIDDELDGAAEWRSSLPGCCGRGRGGFDAACEE